MGGGWVYQQHMKGQVIDGAVYSCRLSVNGVSSSEETFLPEEGKQYAIFKAKYLHNVRGPTRRKRVMCLYNRQEVVERNKFDIAFATDLYLDIPWRVPEAMLNLTTSMWLKMCSWDALPEFPTARVLCFTMMISGPYHPGGDERLEEVIDDPTYTVAFHTHLMRVDGFDEKEKEVVCTLCSHLFHQHCLVSWLLSYNSCPSCRRLVIQ